MQGLPLHASLAWLRSLTDGGFGGCFQSWRGLEQAACAAQEDDVIGIIASDNIADLKPLGDRILLEARPRAPRAAPPPRRAAQRCHACIPACLQQRSQAV